MTSLKRTARIAGLWYLGFTLGPFYLLYVPSQTVVRNNAGATAARVLSHEALYRWGMLAETLGAVIFIGLSLALYRLFEDVDRHRARQLAGLGAGVVCSGAGERGLQRGRPARLSGRGCLRRFRQPHRGGYRNAPHPDTRTGKWHQPDVLGIVAAALWMVGGALALFATLARILAPAGWDCVGCGGRDLVLRSRFYGCSVPLFPAGVSGRTCGHALAADSGCQRVALSRSFAKAL